MLLQKGYLCSSHTNELSGITDYTKAMSNPLKYKHTMRWHYVKDSQHTLYILTFLNINFISFIIHCEI